MTIYLLPGVGCDRRLFDRLDLPGHRLVPLEWPDFPKRCTLDHIAREMSAQVDANEPHIIAGVSMGGMVAQELAVITNPTKVILISSWIGPHEWPLLVRASARLSLNTFIRDWSLRAAWPLKRLIDRRPSEIDRLLFDMAKKQTARQLRIGTSAILRWPGSRWQGPLVRIHGDKDIVTPLRFPVDHIVKGGQHVMVLTQAEEVSRLISDVINA
ncbi:MAG: alpha/beta hydrolase [Flavobacteriales bacterium]|nr:alpha/beta hydrolase [Flavobacteriales bacterium]